MKKARPLNHGVAGTKFFSDGTRLYFRQSGAPLSSLYQTSIADGRSLVIPVPFSRFEIFDLSPDGTEFLIGSLEGSGDEIPLWVLSAVGGSPRRLGDVTADDAAWSADGRGIVFVKDSDLYLASAVGGDVRKLVSAPATSSWPRWSPDGRLLRFTVQNPKTYTQTLWEVRADGSHLRPLLPGWSDPPNECCGSWTRDGRYYFFQATHHRAANIWAISEKPGLFRRHSGKPTVLTTTPIDYLAPIPGREPGTLYVLGRLHRGELVRWNRASGEFVPYLSGVSAHWATSSRDGRLVTYVTYPDGMLWRSAADGSQALQLTFPPMLASFPVWSPDGRQIAFVGEAPGKPDNVFLIPAGGGVPRALAPEDRNQDYPTRAPDGNFAFGGIVIPERSNASQTHGIQVMDLSTHRLAELPESRGLFSFRWSPDGRYIAATSEDSQAIMILDRTLGRWDRLTSGIGLHYALWSQDSKWVYYQDVYDPGLAVMRLSIRDHHTERVADRSGIRRADFSAAAFTGLAADDSPLLILIRSDADIYRLDLNLP